MHQNAFGGRAPPGSAGGAYSAPQTPYLDLGEGLGGTEGDKDRREEGKGKRGKGRREGGNEGRKGGEGGGESEDLRPRSMKIVPTPTEAPQTFRFVCSFNFYIPFMCTMVLK